MTSPLCSVSEGLEKSQAVSVGTREPLRAEVPATAEVAGGVQSIPDLVGGLCGTETIFGDGT